MVSISGQPSPTDIENKPWKHFALPFTVSRHKQAYSYTLQLWARSSFYHHGILVLSLALHLRKLRYKEQNCSPKIIIQPLSDCKGIWTQVGCLCTHHMILPSDTSTSISVCWVNWINKLRASQVVLVIKNLPANAGDLRDNVLIPGSRRSSGGGHGNPLQYSGESNGQRNLAGYSP